MGELTPQTLTSYEKCDDPLSGGRAEMGRSRLKKTIENPTSNQLYICDGLQWEFPYLQILVLNGFNENFPASHVSLPEGIRRSLSGLLIPPSDAHYKTHQSPPPRRIFDTMLFLASQIYT